MGKHFVTFIFGLMAAAVASQAVRAIGDAFDEARLESWLIAAYSVLKFAVAVALFFGLTFRDRVDARE